MTDKAVWGAIAGSAVAVVAGLVTGALFIGGLEQRVGANEDTIKELASLPTDVYERLAEIEGDLDDRAKQAATSVVARLGLPTNTSPLEKSFTVNGVWGSWSEPLMCPAKTYVCGMRPKIEPPLGGDDDTAMNAVAFYCCSLLGPSEDAEEGQRSQN